MSQAEILDRLYAVIRERSELRPENSYVVSLLDAGVPRIAEKLREEAEELIEAVVEGDADHVANEAADLIFHAWVLLASAGLAPAAVYEVLEARFGQGGIEEKAARSSSVDRK
jgi:phosphoribosyl-ATP pyrophosphohydrolase